MITPIAEKNIGVQSNGLELNLKIWSFFVDAKNEAITVIYDMETLSPTGEVVYCQEQTFTRSVERFNALRNSPIGVAISEMLRQDLDLFPTFE